MQIDKLDHVNIRTNQLQEMITWYGQVLGLQQGDRPDFPFPGAWLYSDNTVVVHLVGLDSEPGAGSETDLKLEHFAFAASGAATFEAKLTQLNQPFKRNELLSAGLVQYNIWDPDGNHIHVDFSVNE